MHWPSSKHTSQLGSAFSVRGAPGTRPAGAFTSVNKNVPISAYPNDVARKQASQLLDATSFKFDLDDAIGGAAQSAIFKGVTEFLADPSSLDSILSGIDAASE